MVKIDAFAVTNEDGSIATMHSNHDRMIANSDLYSNREKLVTYPEDDENEVEERLSSLRDPTSQRKKRAFSIIATHLLYHENFPPDTVVRTGWQKVGWRRNLRAYIKCNNKMYYSVLKQKKRYEEIYTVKKRELSND